MKSRSSSSKLIDNRVFWSMAVCAAISLTVLAFRIKNYEPCSTIEIGVKQGPLYVGELIQFKAITKSNKKNIQWNFGDEIQPNKDGYTVNHTFYTAGRYEVFLNTENQCSAFKTIYVMEAPIVEDEHLKPNFTGPLTVEVGSPAVFEDATPNANQWEWRFGESNDVDATKQKVSYTFKTTGPKTVILTVNEHMQDELMVLVTPKELGKTEENTRIPKPAPKRHEPITPQERPQSETIPETLEEIEKPETRLPNVAIKQLESMVIGMVEGKKTMEDLYIYSCDGQNMQVNYNGKIISIRKLLMELEEMKSENKIKSLKVTVEKDPIRNCIKNMNISLKKKWL